MLALCVRLQSFEPPPRGDNSSSRWVLGWQFAAGEYLQLSRDVFGDEGIQRVYMAPNLADAGEADAATVARGTTDQTRQRVAVFSKGPQLACWPRRVLE